MIVAVDPKSRTSPSSIFDRWKGLIDITVWSNDTFLGRACKKHTFNETKQTDLHRCRQYNLFLKCGKALKLENTTSWVSFTDVDEYIVPNWDFARNDYKIRNYYANMTIFDIFDTNPHLNGNFNSSCFPMARFPVTIQESNSDEVFQHVPVGINATSLVTLNYRYPHVLTKAYVGKAMVDFSRVPSTEFRNRNHAVHRPIKTLCRASGAFIHRQKSAFSVYHYPGSLEAFQFRADPRMFKNRQSERFHQLYGTGKSRAFESDSARFWIQNFVDKVGLARAHELLEGANMVGSGR
jgi:hypothetical protein